MNDVMDKLISKNDCLIVFSIVLMALPLSSSGQDFKNTLEQMRSVYEQMNGLHIKMLVTAYEGKDNKGVIYQLKVDIKKKGNDYLYQYDNNTMLMNERYIIMVDGDSYEMICSRRNSSMSSGATKLFNFDMDSILSFYEEPKYLGRIEKVEYYQVDQKIGAVSQVDLAIDTQTKLIKNMAYQYRQGPYVKIEFNLFDGSPSFRDDTFNEGRFISINNGKLIASETYQNYHFTETVSD